MIESPQIKPSGWQRLVAELTSGAPDDAAFLDRLLRILAQASAARQAVLFAPVPGGSGEADVRPVAIYPGALPGAPAGETPEIASQPQARQAALAAVEANQSRVFSLGASELYDAGSGGSGGYVLALPIGTDAARAAGVVTLLIEARSRQAVQSTLAMAELISGYVHAHAAKQELRRQQTSGRALELATRLIGAINAAPSFKGACMQVVNDLAKTCGADRAALGWVRADSVRVQAISDTEHFDRRMAMVQRLATAMDECLDQEQPVLHPAPPAAEDVLLSQAITHSHRELAGGDPTLHVLSVPLRDGERVMGVLTLEAKTPRPGPGGSAPAGAGLDLRAVELIQSAMDLVSPVLAIRKSDDRALPLRAVDSTVRAGAWVVGAKHTAWKLVGLAVMAAALFVTFFTITYRVGASAELRPRESRTISAPFDGVVGELGVGQAGTVVRAGDVLLRLDTIELEQEASAIEARIAAAEQEYATAMKDQQTAEAKLAEAERREAEANLALVRSRIERATVRAPVDGTLLAGDLRDKVGASVKLGDALYQLAPLDDMIAVARVDERDVALVAAEGKGTIATRSHPGRRFPVVIERIVPLAEPVDGRNAFEVRVRLDETAGWMRPGMEGIVRLEAGERSLLWIGTRRVIEELRLWLW